MSDHTYEDRQALKLAQRRARIADAQERSTTVWIMSTQQGREWMYRLLELCHIGQSPFTGDNDQTNFQCGEQNIGLRLWGSLQGACPDLYLLMMQEANERSISTDAQLAGSPNGDGGVEGTDLNNHRDDEGNRAFDGYNH